MLLWDFRSSREWKCGNTLDPALCQQGKEWNLSDIKLKECTLDFLLIWNKGLGVITHVNSDPSRAVITEIFPLIILESCLDWQRTALPVLETHAIFWWNKEIIQTKAKKSHIYTWQKPACGVCMFAAKQESRIKQMGSVSFSVLTGLRKSIDLVFGIIIDVSKGWRKDSICTCCRSTFLNQLD